MDLELQIETDSAGDVVIRMVGALDLGSRAQLNSTSFEKLADGPASFALDMAEVTFIDSTGIGAIIEIAQRAEELGIKFSINRPSERVVRILRITGLENEWPMAGAADS